MNKVLVMGIDGATWRLLLPWIKEGKLKNFKKFYDSGVSCDFMSTMPVLTPAAWVSITTGKNPGKHGIYHFLDIDKNYDSKIFLSTDIKSKDLFDIVGRHGKRSVAINVPFTYPPKDINGVLVSGMLTPDLKADCIRPKEFRDELLKIVPDYEFEINYSQYVDKHKEFAEAILNVTKKRLKLVKHFLKTQKWDLHFFVLIGADRLQHHMMNKPDVLYEYYSYVDQELGELQQLVGEDTNIFIVSDHGFKPVEKELYITYEFLKQNWIKIPLRQKLFSKFLGTFKAVFGPGSLAKMVLIYKKYRRQLKKISTHEKINIPFKSDFWKNAKAFPFGTSVYVNDIERFKWGQIENKEEVMNTLVEQLKELRDPENGKKILRSVLLGKDFFSGPYTKYAPDISIETVEGYRISPNVFQSDAFLVKSDVLNGDHEIEGVFLAQGPDIAANKQIKPTSVYDFAPTVLHAMGLPVPDDMDGRVLTEIFKEGSGPAKREIKIESVSKKESEKQKLSEGLNGIKL